MEKVLYDVFESKLAYDIFMQKYSKDGKETWKDTCKRVVDSVCGDKLDKSKKDKIYKYMVERKFIPAGRYLYAAGREKHQINNCFAFRAEDSKEGWADLMQKITICLMSGGGIGVDYSALRANRQEIKGSGGFSTGPMALMHMVNEAGRYIMQGGSRRSAIFAGLNWLHPDIIEFMTSKNRTPEQLEMKIKDREFPLPLEGTNISTIYDTEFFMSMDNDEHPNHEHAKNVWLRNVKQAISTAEPGASFNFLNDLESLRNACAEFTSDDDSDRCNLGTVWLNRIKNKEELADVVQHATRFLLCGGMYSDYPTEKIKEVGTRNNRIGLGLGGIHEWLMQRGEKYKVTPELHSWLRIYQQESDAAAYIGAKELGVNPPKAKRALAPNGTIGMLAETTTGIEPLFCKAYKRKYLKDGKWVYQNTVDGSVKRLINQGIDISNIQDCYDISFEDRIKFQADVQNYVDMAISSTCNLPPWGSEQNNESQVEEKAKILYKYAKRLRGFTCYPDGSIHGQPLVRIDLKEAMETEGVVFEDQVRECTNGVCGL